jgi:hypothetical protein
VAPYSLAGVGNWVITVAPYKDFPLKFKDGASMRIGAEIYNVFNHPGYALPNGNLSSPSAGLITDWDDVRGSHAESTGMRQATFELKLIF